MTLSSSSIRLVPPEGLMAEPFTIWSRKPKPVGQSAPHAIIIMPSLVLVDPVRDTGEVGEVLVGRELLDLGRDADRLQAALELRGGGDLVRTVGARRQRGLEALRLTALGQVLLGLGDVALVALGRVQVELLVAGDGRRDAPWWPGRPCTEPPMRVDQALLVDRVLDGLAALDVVERLHVRRSAPGTGGRRRTGCPSSPSRRPWPGPWAGSWTADPCPRRPR